MIHLHAHSAYSLSDGLFSPKQWAKAYKAKGFKAAALTDHGSMAGLLPFYYAMREEKLQPIMGCEFYYVDNPLDKTESNRSASHIILIAKDFEGWQSLLKLSRLSFEEGFYYRPRIGIDWIRAHSAGLVCLTACLGGILSRELWKEREGKPCLGLEERWKQLDAIFGKDLYIEYQGHNADDQRYVHEHFSKRLIGAQHAVTNDNHYILPSHAPVQNLVKASAFRNTEAAASYTSFDSLYLKTPGEVWDAFSEHHGELTRRFVLDGMKATHEIAEKCAKFELPKKRYLPTFKSVTGETSRELFRRLTTVALGGFFKRSGFLYASRDEYLERFKKEYDVIIKYGLEDYFLIVWDIVQFAKRAGIYVGIGRGSAAGSLILYLLEVVKINPLQYGLLFERFLNAVRCETGELPDVDLDFESERRGEVKAYIFERYGKDRVCEIGTYGRMMLKTAIIDFGKQFGFEQRELLQITTNLGLDKTEAQSLDAAFESQPKLQAMMKSKPGYEFAVRAISGQIKSQSVHPAGVLICSERLDTVTPLKTQKKKGEEDEDGDGRVIVTQAEDKYVLAQGLVKMDILGLKEYDIFKFVIENSPSGLTVNNYVDEIHDRELTHPDEKVWEMFRKGRTEAVFQFGSSGMKQLLIDMEADSLGDLIAAVALYRPGCLENGWHTNYYMRKHGREEIEDIHPIVTESLKDTYGVPVYQEQVMAIIHLLGNVPLTDADTIRSALGKKDDAKLEKFREVFVSGATKHVGPERASEIWDQLKKSAGYSFNKCLSSKEVIFRHWSKCQPMTIGEMYRLMNGGRKHAALIGRLPLYKKMQRVGYGFGWSMRDGRLHQNRIIDIRHEGKREVYRCVTDSGRKIDVTLNHKFPTPYGERKLEDLRVGNELYVNLGYRHVESVYRFTDRVGSATNAPAKGQCGFQKVDGSEWALFVERRKILKDRHDECEICLAALGRKEMHHIDGDHGNQAWENLQIVCPSCHKRAHYKMGRIKRGEKGYEVGLEKIASIEFLEITDVYDVEMESPSHNFAVASGIVTSNSHSAVYALVAYISQWLKVHHTPWYWAAVLDWDSRKKDWDNMLVNKRAATTMGVRFSMPDINRSGTIFKVEGKEVVWSLTGIRGIGKKTAEEVLRHAPFKSFEDFYKRVHKSRVRLNHILAMLYAGAFDKLGDRAGLLTDFMAMKKGKTKKKLPRLTSEHLALEFYNAVGFFENRLTDSYPDIGTKVLTEDEVVEIGPGEPAIIAGMVATVKSIRTRKGDAMGKLTIVDAADRFEVTVFPTAWTKYRTDLRVGYIVKITGKKSDYGGRQNQVEVDSLTRIAPLV